MAELIRVMCPLCQQTAWWDDATPLFCTRCGRALLLVGRRDEGPADEPAVVVRREPMTEE